ncbi:hypothetical protein GO491_02385 [Flavobacteriaceae bacterium Ap0902]|nr:hypothetical protein [Flavobacteriaceae bacterium Ap0902]
MRAKSLILPKKLLVGMAGVSIAMIIGIFFNIYNDVPIDMSWLYIALMLFFVPFLAVLVDIIQNPIADKITWVIFLTLFTILATFVYLIMREKVLIKSNLD